MAAPRKIVLALTAEHFRDADMGSGPNSPVALALKEKEIWANCTLEGATWRTGKKQATCKFPPTLKAALLAYQEGQAVSPITVELDVSYVGKSF